MLTDLLRNGARHLIQQAVEEELSDYMKQYSGQTQSDVKAAVIRNGYHPVETAYYEPLGTNTG